MQIVQFSNGTFAVRAGKMYLSREMGNKDTQQWDMYDARYAVERCSVPTYEAAQKIINDYTDVKAGPPVVWDIYSRKGE